MCRSNVVLPLPRGPVIRVMGVRGVGHRVGMSVDDRASFAVLVSEERTRAQTLDLAQAEVRSDRPLQKLSHDWA